MLDTQAGPFGFASRSSFSQFVVFTLDESLYALRLFSVERIVRMVEITALPQAPEMVLGVINLHGEIIPVLDVRKRFGLAERELDLSDHLIIARTPRRKAALAVHAAIRVVERPEAEVTAADRVLPGLEYVEGVVKLEDGVILIHNLEAFLSLEEESAIEQAMALT